MFNLDSIDYGFRLRCFVRKEEFVGGACGKRRYLFYFRVLKQSSGFTNGCT
jgi:hypothetical protein